MSRVDSQQQQQQQAPQKPQFTAHPPSTKRVVQPPPPSQQQQQQQQQQPRGKAAPVQNESEDDDDNNDDEGKGLDLYLEAAQMEGAVADDGDRVPCNNCGRRFLAERLEKHEKACSSMKKRKVFDVKKQRLEGELAQYARVAEKNDAMYEKKKKKV